MSANPCTGPGGRGCSCRYHVGRRKSNSAWARRNRARKLDARRQSARTCPRRFGAGFCGGVLESDIVNGALVVTCPLCERFERGICRDCPRPVDGATGRARRCTRCKVIALDACVAMYVTRNKEELRVKARRRYQTDDAIRQANNEYKKAWRKANPEKVKAQKQRWGKKQAASIYEYQSDYRATHRRKLRNQRRQLHQDTRPLRRCITPRCSIVVTGRKKKCTRCRERERMAALSALSRHAGRGRRTDLERAS